MRILFLSLAILISTYCCAQNDWFNSEDFWKTVLLENTAPASIDERDTVLIVASNRNMQAELRFMSETRNADSIHYFFVYTQNSNWHVLPTRSLEEAVSYMPDVDRDWVIYTEGMGKIFTSDLYRGLQMAGQYNVNVLLMDYPSISTDKGRLGNYFYAIRNARVAYEDFVPVFEEVKRLKDENRLGSGNLTLFFHSMGNNVIKELVENDMLRNINNKVWADNLVLNAPCIFQRKHAQWLNKIRFAQNIYVHYNPGDFVLGAADVVSFHKQLGKKIQYPLSKGATYINFNKVVDNQHSNFLTLSDHSPVQPAAIKHYETVLHGKKAPIMDANLYRLSDYRRIGYDLLTENNDGALSKD